MTNKNFFDFNRIYNNEKEKGEIHIYSREFINNNRLLNNNINMRKNKNRIIIDNNNEIMFENNNNIMILNNNNNNIMMNEIKIKNNNINNNNDGNMKKNIKYEKNRCDNLLESIKKYPMCGEEKLETFITHLEDVDDQDTPIKTIKLIEKKI